MPRRARLKFTGAPLHIVQRGNNRIACFFAEEDYRLHLRHLQELSQRFECGVHACHRILKLARTIADLAGVERISDAQVAEAIQYRRFDRA